MLSLQLLVRINLSGARLPEIFALACAGADNKEHCWELSGATDQWTQVGDTTYDHYSGDLAKFKKSAVIVGGFSDTHGATEIFDPIQKASFANSD